VYEVTSPNNHITSKITKIVQSMPVLQRQGRAGRWPMWVAAPHGPFGDQ
jgi:hypothetical protein